MPSESYRFILMIYCYVHPICAKDTEEKKVKKLMQGWNLVLWKPLCLVLTLLHSVCCKPKI